MASEISVKAPGKILWIGGYSVLERPNTSYVSAVDAYVAATLKTRESQEVDLKAPQLEMSSKGFVDANAGHVSMNVTKELMLFKTAAEVASRYAAGLGKKVTGFTITTTSDAPFAYSISTGKVVKSGLGSSAAVTVATVGAVLKSLGISFEENDALHKLSQIAHSIATGKVGSGFDIAAASYGSILYTRYSPEIVKGLPASYTNEQLVELVKRKWDYTIEKFSMPEEFRLLFANFGESMITTQAVGSVSKFKENDPHVYADLIKEINDENAAAVKALRDFNKGNMDALKEFGLAFDRGRSLTKKLGVLSNVDVEPDDCSELIEESKNHGAFVAKLPGAGGKDAIAAISMGDKNREDLRVFWSARKELNISDIKIVKDGVL